MVPSGLELTVDGMLATRSTIIAKCSTIYGPKDLGDDFVANGEIGKVVGIFPGVMHVYFDCRGGAWGSLANRWKNSVGFYAITRRIRAKGVSGRSASWLRTIRRVRIS